MPNAVAYLRWSTDRQDLSGDAQRAAIRAWAERDGVNVVAWFEDAGVSGSVELEDRPGLLAATEALDGVKMLVVAKRDRLARDVLTAALVERLCGRKGVAVVSADGQGNGSTAEAAMLRGMLDVFAQYERALIRARTKAALAAKRARGEKCGGRVPFGFVEADGKIIPCEDEQRALRTARCCWEEGFSLRAIGRELVDRGLRPRGGGEWHPNAIRRMLTR